MRDKVRASSIPAFFYDINNWNEITNYQLSHEQQIIFNKRKTALELYMTTDLKISEITDATKMSKRELYQIVTRALTMKNDFEIFGYEALIPNKKIASISNCSPLEMLIQSNSKIHDDTIKLITNENRKGKPTLKYVHERFLKICMKHGVKKYEYPFTLKDYGYRQFIRYIEKLKQEKEKNKSQMVGEIPLNEHLLQPLEQVEIDGHRIDAYFVTEITLPSGTTRKTIIERPWVLCAIDRSTRCILGYHLTTNTEYNSNDVISCIENCLIPKNINLSTLATQKLSPKGGFPNQIFQNLKYAVMSEIYLDNAMSHLSNITLNTLVDKIGIALTFGKVAEPTRRGIIERFF
ncbi:hypothetical protein ACWOBH_05005 [Globicatella sanguinis]